MERKNHSDDFDDNELVVADILLQLPEIIFIADSRLLNSWSVKRKIFDIDPPIFVFAYHLSGCSQSNYPTLLLPNRIESKV